MRRTLGYLSTAFVFFVLMLAFATSSTRTAKADPPDRCLHCLENVQAHFEKCLAKYGENHIPCYDEFNEGIVHCYAHFCEQ